MKIEAKFNTCRFKKHEMKPGQNLQFAFRIFLNLKMVKAMKANLLHRHELNWDRQSQLTFATKESHLGSFLTNSKLKTFL